MKDIKPILRKGYLDALSSLTYLGVSIPVDHEFLTKQEAILPIGNSTKVKAYVIIQNQTVTDDSPKCLVNQNTSLQLDVVTIFNANAGTAYHSEQISNAILDILFPGSSLDMELSLQYGNLWRGWLESTRTIVQETNTSRIFRNILIFNHTINQ